jgi:D-3-phosphoglycerate dehydrogenase / 2-oxoglutarate reductase
MVKKFPFIVIDFDSTFIKLEALDELSKIVLTGNPEREKIVKEIERITNLGMEGTISFPESLSRRLQLFKPHKNHITRLVEHLKNNISDSIIENQQFFLNHAESIYLISGGFTDYIFPVVESFSITQSHILANKFIYDDAGFATGFDKTSYLCQENGKVKQTKALKLDGNIWVIGDGYTDYQIKELGAADKFFAFTENISRASVIEKADGELNNFSDFTHYFPATK